VEIIEGRGVKLEDIPSVKEKIESFTNSSKEIVAAHAFLWRANIGKPESNHRREHLLSFSGYLPATVEGEDEDEVEKADTKIEVSFRFVCRVLFLAFALGHSAFSHMTLLLLLLLVSTRTDENGPKGVQTQKE
jgi:hypothetical protein